MNATKMDIRGEIRRLQDGGYNVPRDTDVDRLTDVWSSILEGFSAAEVTEAVTSYIRDGKHYWPKPGEILARARGASEDDRGRRVDNSPRGVYLRWEQHQEGGCPVCGAVVQLHRGRYHVLHDVRRHREAGIPHVGLPMSQEDREMYERYGSWRERRQRAREEAARRRAMAAKPRETREPTESERRAKEAAAAHLARQRDPSQRDSA